MAYTIEDIKIKRTERRVPEEKVERVPEEAPRSTKPPVTPPRARISNTPRRKKSRGSKSIIIVCVVAILLFSGYAIANKFAHVTVLVKEKEQTFTLAKKQLVASKAADAALHFEVVIIPDQHTNNITLTQTQNISTKAHGTVTLYNTWSSKPVSIASGTYLADEKGVSYRTDKAVSIPGFTGTGSAIKPGSISVGATSFLAGATYNGSPTNFYITSFKSNATKYKQIYGKASTPMAGGASGLMYNATDSKSKALLDSWKNDTSYEATLLKKVEVPPGYILYPDATTYASTVDSNVLSATPNAQVNITSTLSAVLLKKDDLTNILIKNFIPNVGDKEISEIDLTNLDSLTFSFTNPSQVINKDLQTVSLTLDGSLHALWQPDLEALKSSLAGVAKNSTGSIFQQDVGIEDATVTMFPPWASYAPTDTEKIDIKTQ